jgi:hypothetical protein
MIQVHLGMDLLYWMNKLQSVKVRICAPLHSICVDDRTVLALYSKSGGRNGAHGLVFEAANIAAISYVVVQSFEHFTGAQFRAIPQTLQSFQAKRFAHLPSSCFLCGLDQVPSSVEGGIKISVSDHERFKSLISNAIRPLIVGVVKKLRARKKDALDNEIEAS